MPAASLCTAPLLPRARSVSRAIVVGSVGLAALTAGGPGRGVRQAMTLGVLALGMPHGAADTELLRWMGRGRRRRHLELLGAYASAAVAATAVVRSDNRWVERLTLAASAAHFAEGELACWGAPPRGATTARTVLRAALAATTTALLPAAISRAQRGDLRVGASGAVAGGPGPTGGEHSGLQVLRGGVNPAARVAVALTGLCVAGAAALAADGDPRAALDTALLTALDVVAGPSLAFAAYFGGWHSLRHTARVAEALISAGQLPEQSGLGAAVTALARRSGWAATVGIISAGALAAAQPERLTDNAFAAVLGLTVPHMATVTAALARRRR